MKDDLAIFVLDDDDDRKELIKFRFTESGIKNFFFYKTEEEFFLAFNNNVRLAIINHHINGNVSAQNIIVRIEELDKKNESIIPTRVIIISGQRDPNMVIFYSSHKAEYINKLERGFIDILIHFVKTHIEDVASRLEINDQRLEIKQDVDKLLTLAVTEEPKDE